MFAMTLTVDNGWSKELVSGNEAQEKREIPCKELALVSIEKLPCLALCSSVIGP
jgi:hypothetical protein